MTRPLRAWLRNAREDFDSGNETWGHRDIRFAVYPHNLANIDIYGNQATMLFGDLRATRRWFMMRRDGMTPAEIVAETLKDRQCKS